MGDTPHQDSHGPPNERRLLLSGTFLAFHSRKMPDGQNIKNVLVNNKFLRVTEHISSSLSKKACSHPFEAYTDIFAHQGFSCQI